MRPSAVLLVIFFKKNNNKLGFSNVLGHKYFSMKDHKVSYLGKFTYYIEL